MEKLLVNKFMNTAAGKLAASYLSDPNRDVRQIMEMVHLRVIELTPYLAPGCKYQIHDLFYGESRWNSMSDGKHRVAGMILAFLVREKVVDLYLHVTPSGKGTNKYLITRPSGQYGDLIEVSLASKKVAVSSGGVAACL